MIMYIKTLLLFLGLTLFTACGANTTPQAHPSTTAKSWKNAAPADNASYFYA
jgi:hypothetical protein